jgi:hypothetical protein
MSPQLGAVAAKILGKTLQATLALGTIALGRSALARLAPNAGF